MNRIIPLALSIVMGIMGCIGAGKPSQSNAQAAYLIEQTSLTATATASITTTSIAVEETTAATDTTTAEETTEAETTVKETTKKVETTTKKVVTTTTTKAETTTKKVETTTKKAETTTKKVETTKAKNEPQTVKVKKSDGYIWPAVSDAIVTAGYPYYSSGSYHGGVDIALYGESGDNITENTHIYAAKDGVVVAAYNDGQWNTGFGNHCIIDHGNGVQTLYAHANEIRVSEGDTVKQGQIIGLVGDTGNTTAPHLHFEVRTESGDGGFERQNPMKFISEP